MNKDGFDRFPAVHRATARWRMLGLWFGGGVDEGSEILVWVRAVATATFAGVIAQILVGPPGALASVPDRLRYAAVAAGFAAFIVDFGWCRLWRIRDACWQMVARLIVSCDSRNA